MTYPPALPKWEGGWSVDGCDDFPSQCWLKDGLSFSPLGETGEGFVVDSGHAETCRSRGGIICPMLTPVLTYDLESTKRIVLEQLKTFRAKVYLFGSQATGKARLYSDIDVAILPLEPLPIHIVSEIRERLEESNILRKVDVVDLSISDDAFLQRVEREGVLWKE